MTTEEQAGKIIEEYGKQYIPALLPNDIPRGETSKCFDTCALLAAHNRKYHYVEGAARVAGEEAWILHAWLTDGIHAFDPTWDALDDNGDHKVIPADYIGIEMPIKKVAKFMSITGYQGVLGNRWRNFKLADACLPAKVAA